MDFGRAVELAEKYLREFVVFFVAFLTRSEVKEDDLALDEMQQGIVFAIMSAILSAYLWYALVTQPLSEIVAQGGDGTDQVIRDAVEKSGALDLDFTLILTQSLLSWFTLGVFFALLLRAFGVGFRISEPFLIVFRLFAISRLVGVYAGYVTLNLFEWFPSVQLEYSHSLMWPIIAGYLVQDLVVWIYIWWDARRLSVSSSRIRTNLAVLVFLVITTIVGLIPLNDYIHATKVPEPYEIFTRG